MPEVSVDPVTRDDVVPLIRMELPEDQESFVARNAVSLAQVSFEGGAYAFCIRADGERAGLIQVIDCRESPNLEDGDDPQAIYLWRLMVAQEFQRLGIGRKVVEWLEGWARARGAPRIAVTCVPENEAALGLYESVGFARTGRVPHGEAELVWDLERD